MRLARLGFFVALVIGALVVAKQFPFDTLLHGRAAVAASVRELDSLEQSNKALSQQIAQLRQPSTIERIAHADYGLVLPGQTFEVVLPEGGHGHVGTDPLADAPLPRSVLVPNDSAIANPPGTAADTGKVPSFWTRLLDRLEFWKASS